MNREKCIIHVSRMLVVIMLFSVCTFAPVPAAAAEDELTVDMTAQQNVELNDLIAQAEALKAGNQAFLLQVSQSGDGSDVNQAFPWVSTDELRISNMQLNSHVIRLLLRARP